ncbi:MAG: flagellar hook-basal body complex protein [Desulfobacteraceae bacterium]|nr:flagellar hook-basal body complex protein [Desulfobacteraceae bacterium]
MSLSSSLFTGTSGLKNMGNALQVVGNNIANLNTVGFKKGRATFADTLYESVATQGGTDQMGRGMAVGDVSQNFSQGSFESTGNTTDLSIGGDGFFVMRQSGTENSYYTRAGNFFFNKDGELVNPEGYIVQGWALDEDTGDDTGSIGDIVLSAFTNSPKKTSQVTAITRLDADAISNTAVLANEWDSGEDTYIGSANYEYQTVIKAYDSLGSTHDVTIYYDKKSGTEWDYIVTCNPGEDQRNLLQNTGSLGLLAKGNITFSQSGGDIMDLTMQKLTGLLGNFNADGVNDVDDVEYFIDDYDAFGLDGYGFEFEYDGTSWDFVDGYIPDNYSGASIVYSDSTNIHIALSSDTDPDIKIQLVNSASANDTLGFDINKTADLHVQGIGLPKASFGDLQTSTLEDYTINDASVMTHDSDGVGIAWHSVDETWYWSNPDRANSAATLLSSITLQGSSQAATAFVSVTTASVMDMVSDDVTLRVDYRTSEWDWNMPMKTDDFTSDYSNFSTSVDPTLTLIEPPGSQGAVASTNGLGSTTWVSLSWDGSAWTPSSGGGETLINIDTVNSDKTQVQFDIWEGDGSVLPSSGLSTFVYNFDALSTAGGTSETITFKIDPTPPAEYPDAVLSTVGSTTSGIGIDFDDDSAVDIQMKTSAGGGITGLASNGGLTMIFDIDPDVPPENYDDATLKGDSSQAVIDLDGSGGASDDDDIVFDFSVDLLGGASADPYDYKVTIEFDIDGSTAWTNIATSDMTSDGYFAFAADFLGGEFGTTEQDIELNIGTIYDGSNFVNDSLSSIAVAGSSSTLFQEADGYSAGDLQGVDVGSDGIMTGIYSNGQLIPLFRVGLAKFLNNYGLTNEGGNLFAETLASGSAITNKPGENGLGTLSPNSLEMSNVDISEEFVSLIVNQRGFQANSKTITTIDDMMSTVIQMKR